MDAVVEATDVEKAYGETAALSGATLSVDAGEVFALIGPNGAGKTTLVRALTGTSEPDSGTARVLGQPPPAVDRASLGVLPQEFSPPDRLTARELLVYYAGLFDDPRDPEAVLADVGLVDAADTWYEELSGGQQRRVCVGATLVNDPEVLFLDEPTTGIDPAGRRTVWRLIEALAAGGTTVVLTTHDMAEAERLADRVGLLANGSIVAQGTPDSLVAEHGGSSRLVIETDADPDAFAALEYAVERPDRDPADSRPGARTSDGAVVVRDVDAAGIASVVAFLEERDVAYSGLTWGEPGLEDVYLALADQAERERTGRSNAAGGDETTAAGGDETTAPSDAARANGGET